MADFHELPVGSITHSGVVFKTYPVIEESDGYYIIMKDEKPSAVQKDDDVKVAAIVVAESLIR